MKKYDVPQSEIKLVAIDVDDTLITADLRIPESARSTIGKALDHGIGITLATGRMFQAVLPYARLLGLRLPMISYNGALMKDPESLATIFHQGVSPILARKIIQFCREHHFSLNIYVDDELYVEEMNHYVQYYLDLHHVAAHQTDLAEMVSQLPAEKQITKLLIITEEELSRQWAPVLAAKYQDSLYVTRSKARFIEFLNPAVNKGACLGMLAQKLAIPRAAVMAVGDSYNDIAMFNYAGFSVALGKVPDAVRQAANVVIESDPETALSETLERYLFPTSRRVN